MVNPVACFSGFVSITFINSLWSVPKEHQTWLVVQWDIIHSKKQSLDAIQDVSTHYWHRWNQGCFAAPSELKNKFFHAFTVRWCVMNLSDERECCPCVFVGSVEFPMWICLTGNQPKLELSTSTMTGNISTIFQNLIFHKTFRLHNLPFFFFLCTILLHLALGCFSPSLVSEPDHTTWLVSKSWFTPVQVRWSQPQSTTTDSWLFFGDVLMIQSWYIQSSSVCFGRH